jgi:hypothetical protein
MRSSFAWIDLNSRVLRLATFLYSSTRYSLYFVKLDCTEAHLFYSSNRVTEPILLSPRQAGSRATCLPSPSFVSINGIVGGALVFPSVSFCAELTI